MERVIGESKEGTVEKGKNLHLFAVCAYKDSPYLEECIRSLKRQRVKSGVILCTSTPSPFLREVAERHQVPLFVREGESGIRQDWRFAYEKADAKLVTIVHQDDWYGRNYTKTLLKAYEQYPDMTLFASDYLTLRMTKKGAVLKCFTSVRLVKKLLRLPLRLRFFSDRRWIKKSALLLGNSICCPTCTYRKEWLLNTLFQSNLEFALDWDNLYELAKRPGRFICSEKPLLAYRIHGQSATKECIKAHTRIREEIAMFEKMWPKPLVRALMHFYKKAHDAYQ